MYNQDASEHVKNIRLGTLNSRSIKCKEELIIENFNEYYNRCPTYHINMATKYR